MKSMIQSSYPSATVVLCLVTMSFFCMQTDDEIRPKEGLLNNQTASFIYNAIPGDEAATITPGYNTAINSFAVNLLHALCSSDSLLNKNLVISPLNISRNLAIVTEAAEGETKQELLTALGGQEALDGAKNALAELLYADTTVILQIADAIWVNSSLYELIPSYVSLAKSNYGVYSTAIDFTNKSNTVTTVNKWIEDNTAHNIKNMINETYIHPLTACFITSAIYFKADWASPFDISKTTSGPFSTPRGISSVTMMVSDECFQTVITDTYCNTRLYYGTDRKNYFFIDLYMPVGQSIPDFLQEQCPDVLGGGDSIAYRSVRMPKFVFENTLDLSSALKEIGINLAFDAIESKITGMAVWKNTGVPAELYIDTIVHCAGIRTDEEGTEAYAATVTALSGKGLAPAEEIIFNKPFIYFIRAGENGLILFAGIMNNPGERS
ncbi:MAG: hypothetical protein JW863_03525 [Chitinispirillaceae bacterium]|nr:hypothetical protein [Chitinispirillaceae bacterium]